MSPRQKLNEEIAKKLEEMHTESPDKGYRRLRDDLEVYHNIPENASNRAEYRLLSRYFNFQNSV